jgi:uncharacterized membrane protein YbhN (UPF0104 family)
VVLQDNTILYGEILSFSEKEVNFKTLSGEEISILTSQIARDKKGLKIAFGFFKVFGKLNIPYFLIFASFICFNVIIATFRFQFLVNSQGIPVSWGTLLKVNLIGGFFNHFLPGETGGDLMRAYYMARGAEQKARAVITVIMDRVIGLFALVLLATSVLIFHVAKPEFLVAGAVVLLSLGGMLLGFTVIFLLPERFFAEKPGILFQVVEAFCRYRHHIAPILYSIGTSLLLHISTIIAVIGFSRALGIDYVPWFAFCIYVPVGFLVMALPISIAGWGVGEATFSWLFLQVGVPVEQGVILMLLIRLPGLGLAILGGFIWLMEKRLQSQKFSQV